MPEINKPAEDPQPQDTEMTVADNSSEEGSPMVDKLKNDELGHEEEDEEEEGDVTNLLNFHEDNTMDDLEDG